MQPNKTKIALVLGALLMGASGASNAAVQGSFPVKVATLADVILTQVTALDFGANVYSAAGGTCKLDGSNPVQADSQVDVIAAGGTGVGYNQLSGTGCITDAQTDGVPLLGQSAGVYNVAGIGGLDVTVTVSDSAISTDFTFSPDSACVTDYNGAAATSAGDLCLALSAGTGKLVTLADATDALNAGAPDGSTRIVVGGTITVGAGDLTPSTAYADTFNVNVIY